jgi:DnaK suppressor protein
MKKQKKSAPEKTKPAKKVKPLIIRKAVIEQAPKSEKKKSLRLSDSSLEELKELLVGMRQRLSSQVEALKGESLQRADEVNVEEDGTDAFDRQFALNLASTENDEIYEIDEALRRIEQKVFGLCEDCGCPIEIARLKALPFVKLCIKCKSSNEKGTPKFKPLPALEHPV